MTNPAMGQPLKRVTQMTYNQGPMGFLADQIVKEMHFALYPAKVFQLYRPPEAQQEMVDRGVSKARPWDSAHQHHGAVDIIHDRWAWFAHPDAPDGAPFWDTLWDCAHMVADKFGVQFDPRLSWDAAHIELRGWEHFRAWKGDVPATQTQLDDWFSKVLPAVWKQHKRSAAYENRVTAGG